MRPIWHQTLDISCILWKQAGGNDFILLSVHEFCNLVGKPTDIVMTSRLVFCFFPVGLALGIVLVYTAKI